MAPEPHFVSEATLRLSSSRQWPGERNPDHTDVEVGNQAPASVFLEQFQAALLHSFSLEAHEVVELDPRILEHEMNQATAGEQYTYPMALLSRVLSVPTDDEIARLQDVFAGTFKHHVFIQDLDLTANSRDNVPPYLLFACAALAALFSGPADSPSPPHVWESASLFHTGVHLWIVMLESDNREARLMEAVYASVLLATYGVLSADRASWRKACGLLCNVVVIVRRIHVTDGFLPIHGRVVDTDVNMRSSLLSYMLLLDALQTLHCNSVPNFSVSEVFVRMPRSNYPFRKLYQHLTHGIAALPADVTSPEDGLLLLIALLNDVTYTQKSYLPLIRAQKNEIGVRRSFDSSAGHERSTSSLSNLFAPLTSHMEYNRLTTMLYNALTRWEHHFQKHVGRDMMALCRFIRIQLVVPDLNELPLQVQYARSNDVVPTPTSPRPGTKDVDIPDKAAEIAGQILDDAEAGNASRMETISIWVPIVVFMAALVVWKKVRSQRTPQPLSAQGGAAGKGGSVKRALDPFARQLAMYPWPCCGEMIAVLERLSRN